VTGRAFDHLMHFVLPIFVCILFKKYLAFYAFEISKRFALKIVSEICISMFVNSSS
jgi:hypothetical protein